MPAPPPALNPFDQFGPYTPPAAVDHEAAQAATKAFPKAAAPASHYTDEQLLGAPGPGIPPLPPGATLDKLPAGYVLDKPQLPAGLPPAPEAGQLTSPGRLPAAPEPGTLSYAGSNGSAAHYTDEQLLAAQGPNLPPLPPGATLDPPASAKLPPGYVRDQPRPVRPIRRPADPPSRWRGSGRSAPEQRRSLGRSDHPWRTGRSDRLSGPDHDAACPGRQRPHQGGRLYPQRRHDRSWPVRRRPAQHRPGR